jgi:hypothetical protein
MGWNVYLWWTLLAGWKYYTLLRFFMVLLIFFDVEFFVVCHFRRTWPNCKKIFHWFLFAYISVNILGTSRNCFSSICQHFLIVYIRCCEHYTAETWCDKNKIRGMDRKEQPRNLQGRAFCCYILLQDSTPWLFCQVIGLNTELKQPFCCFLSFFLSFFLSNASSYFFIYPIIEIIKV